jgi:hypothetical protein
MEGMRRSIWNFYVALKHNQCRHGDALSIAPSAPFQGRACCKRYAIKRLSNTNNTFTLGS